MAITLDGSSGITTPGLTDSGNLSVTGTSTLTGAVNGAVLSPYTMKNRIINGAMVIDQRNAGASVVATNQNYTLDRWTVYSSQTSKFTVQQNAGSVTPPSGFINYLGMTSSSAYSLASGDYFGIRQAIEGLNISDLNWGSANAQTVTLQFRAYSSLTGTFGGCIQNSGGDRSYPFTYTISAANTWTTISVTIPGDTTGTWLKTNGIGIYVYFPIGVGSSFSGAAGSWSGSTYFSATGATSVVGTNGATFYITGVQLERGSTATEFEWRLYGNELQLCQRYYLKLNSGAQTTYTSFGVGVAYSTTSASMTVNYPVQMRSAPTYNYGGSLRMLGGGAGISVTASNLGNTSYLSSYVTVTVASGLTTGNAYWFGPNGDSTAYIDFSAEL